MFVSIVSIIVALWMGGAGDFDSRADFRVMADEYAIAPNGECAERVVPPTTYDVIVTIQRNQLAIDNPRNILFEDGSCCVAYGNGTTETD